MGSDFVVKTLIRVYKMRSNEENVLNLGTPEMPINHSKYLRSSQ